MLTSVVLTYDVNTKCDDRTAFSVNVCYSVSACYRETCDVWLRTRRKQQSSGEKRRAFDDDSVSNGDEDEERRHKLSLKYYETERRQNCTPSRRRGAGRISMLNGRASELYTLWRYVTATYIQREENYTP